MNNKIPLDMFPGIRIFGSSIGITWMDGDKSQIKRERPVITGGWICTTTKILEEHGH